MEFTSKEQLQNFYAEFNATEETLNRDVAHLMDWMEKQPHLPNIEDEDFLKSFLLRCKNSLEKTKMKLDLYYTMRAIMPELYEDRDPCLKELKSVMDYSSFSPAKKLTPEGYRVVFYNVFGTDATIPHIDSMLKCLQMSIDVHLKVDKVNPVIAIHDFSNMTTQYITTMVPHLKKIMLLLTKVTPCRFHKIYLVNMMPAVEHLVTLAKTFMKKNVAERIEVWKDDPKTLVKVLPRNILPARYGGVGASVEELRDNWYNVLQQYQDWLIQEENIKADLNKRPKDHSYNHDFLSLGVEGSFRKICLD